MWLDPKALDRMPLARLFEVAADVIRQPCRGPHGCTHCRNLDLLAEAFDRRRELL